MKRVLIADDEAHVIRLLKQSLERQGFQVEGVLNGEAALEKIHQCAPDVLITDIQMPKLTGEQLCIKIQEKWPKREFPILVLTSRTEIEHRVWSKNIDNLMFLEKPVSIRRLVASLNDYFTVNPISRS